MAQPVDRVEREWCGEDRLACVLDALREARDDFDDSCAVERRRRDEVRDREAVQDCRTQRSAQRHARRNMQKAEELRTDAEAGAGHTVSNRCDPCELRLVDCEVGSARALEALRVEDVAACRRGDRLDLDEAREAHR